MTDCMYWFGLNHRAVEGEKGCRSADRLAL